MFLIKVSGFGTSATQNAVLSTYLKIDDPKLDPNISSVAQGSSTFF